MHEALGRRYYQRLGYQRPILSNRFLSISLSLSPSLLLLPPVIPRFPLRLPSRSRVFVIVVIGNDVLALFSGRSKLLRS